MPALSSFVFKPQPMTDALSRSFRSAAYDTARYARSIAPGPRTARATRVNNVTFGQTTALLTALGRGPSIYPIVSGSKPGRRTSTRGWFVIPGGPVVRSIQHPGTPPHPFIDEAAGRFRSFYQLRATAEMRRFTAALFR